MRVRVRVFGGGLDAAALARTGAHVSAASRGVVLVVGRGGGGGAFFLFRQGGGRGGSSSDARWRGPTPSRGGRIVPVQCVPSLLSLLAEGGRIRRGRRGTVRVPASSFFLFNGFFSRLLLLLLPRQTRSRFGRRRRRRRVLGVMLLLLLLPLRGQVASDRSQEIVEILSRAVDEVGNGGGMKASQVVVMVVVLILWAAARTRSPVLRRGDGDRGVLAPSGGGSLALFDLAPADLPLNLLPLSFPLFFFFFKVVVVVEEIKVGGSGGSCCGRRRRSCHTATALLLVRCGGRDGRIVRGLGAVIGGRVLSKVGGGGGGGVVVSGVGRVDVVLGRRRRSIVRWAVLLLRSWIVRRVVLVLNRVRRGCSCSCCGVVRRSGR